MVNMIDVYGIDDDGYIVSIKTVKEGYVLDTNELEGTAPYGLNYHHQTGIERPMTDAEEYDKERGQAIRDLEYLDKDLELGIATQEEYDTRKSEWLVYHEANKDKRKKKDKK